MVIHIKWNNDKSSVMLPVNPESFRLTDSMTNTSVYVHNLGEINLKGKRALQSITLESFFPCQNYGFLQGQFHNPYDYYIKKLDKVFKENKTVHLIITETSINGYFTIEEFEYGHEDMTKDVAYLLREDQLDREMIVEDIVNFIKDQGGRIENLSAINDMLHSKYSGFDTKSYGYSRLSSFLRNIKEVKVWGNTVSLRKK